MHLYKGTVRDAVDRMSDPAFFPHIEGYFQEMFGFSAEEKEVRSWRQSWPALLTTLQAAGLDDLHLVLEYGLITTQHRVDAMLVGRRGKQTRVVVIELKQWTQARLSDSRRGLVRVGERVTLHPAHQVKTYTHYITHWVSRREFPLSVAGVAVLHNAPAPLIARLRAKAKEAGVDGVPLLGRDDLLSSQSAGELAQRLGCAGMEALAPPEFDRFLALEHRPSPELLKSASTIIEGNSSLTLTPEQEEVRQEILDTVSIHRRDGTKGIVVVTGGAGSGKTVVALKLFGELARLPGCDPRLLSPSGTVTRQMLRAVGNRFKGLISTFSTKIPFGVPESGVVVLDEAHRSRTNPAPHTRFPIVLGRLLDRARTTVLFLDEKQIVRPDEGVTLRELHAHAQAAGYSFSCSRLPTQLRCGGSTAYDRWVEEFLSPEGKAPRWSGKDYDLAVAADPEQFTDWVATHTRAGATARITAGYCWEWKSPPSPPLVPEVEITWRGADGSSRHWAFPWNCQADESDFDEVPARTFWSTDRGGHNQVGCVYTAQGMEYPYSVVILGGDLLRRGDRWVGNPRASHDRHLNHLSPDDYLQYALNTYRVLATRGTKATRFYSTDALTQEYLQALLPPHTS
ncbi:DNA/RNA helicase domain-containing protein [Streptomyces sp. NPDC088923]|uniref:DNA/RNA helicase domain-containing protein n=1 Tax=Streptomyces sp. NPDC088923 TaxID=3365913 RepID=UPI003807747C